MDFTTNAQVTRRDSLKSRVDELKEILDSSEDKDYVTSCMYEIYSELIDNNQFSDEVVTAPVIEEKLIRCHRYIPSFYLDYYGIKKVVIGGLFVKTKICVMPTSLITACMKSNRLGAIIDPECFGLPSSKEVDYGTLRIVNNNIATAIARGTHISDWIDRNYQYEYVTLS